MQLRLLELQGNKWLCSVNRRAVPTLALLLPAGTDAVGNKLYGGFRETFAISMQE